MENSDILIDIQKKIDALFATLKTLDLNIKIISNKLNGINQNMAQSKNVPTIEAPIKIQDITSDSEFKLQIDNNPAVFARTSRAEMHTNIPMMPLVQKVSKPEEAIAQVPDDAFIDHKSSEQNKISVPVIQRVLDKNGKAIFLAGVTINSLASGETVFKGKTTGTGKWSAVLNTGSYRIILTKVESLNKEKLEVIQEILVTGEKMPFELPNLIMK